MTMTEKIEKEYINRKDVLAIIDYLRTKYINNYNRRNKYNQFWSDTIRYIEKKVNDLTTADIAPVEHGHWLSWEEQFPETKPPRKNNLGVFCSACHSHADNISVYCPNCGAKMDG